MSKIFLFCRSGFESELASEISDKALAIGITPDCAFKDNHGFVLFQCANYEQAHNLYTSIEFTQLIFARQWFIVTDLITAMPRANRLSKIYERLTASTYSVQDLFFETPDADQYKPFIKLINGLRNAKKGDTHSEPKSSQVKYRAHACFIATDQCYFGFSIINNSSPWEGGIPKLKLPNSAPSRSLLKLDEALIQFLGDKQRSDYLKPGMLAVDLGAAPGGWSYLLARYSIKVQAIDNGNLSEQLLNTGLVKHLRYDAFTYKPKTPVDWLVCDIVDKPKRVLQLIETWYAQSWTKNCIFNLKLPMANRYDFLKKTLPEFIKSITNKSNIRYHAKQMYHDRLEITIGLISCKPNR